MEIKKFKLTCIKNKAIILRLEKFITNILQKKTDDIFAILLFGSLARKDAIFSDEYQSDVDLLIISHDLPKDILSRKLYTFDLSKTLGLGIDQLWFSPEEIIALVESHRVFFMEIIKYGKILFEKDKFFTKLKKTINTILKEKGIKESKNVWLWPQNNPGCEIKW